MLSFPLDPAFNRILACTACQSKNRVVVSQALYQAEKLRCGQCQTPLLLAKEKPFHKLMAADYQHPLDQQSLKALEAIPGMSTLIKKLVEVTIERYQRLFNRSSYVRVSPLQLPSLLKTFETTAYRLGLVELPELYVYQSPDANAYTGGVEKPYVAVSSGLCDLMNEAELGAVFAHELAHWQSKHVLYKTAARLFTFAAGELAKYTLGISSLIILPLQLALLKWDRCSELSADRGMVLATKDPQLSLQVLMKLAFASAKMNVELSLDEFMKQALSSWKDSQEGVLDRIYSLLQNASRTHPFPLWRAAELWMWICEGEYLPILNRHAVP